MRKSTRTVFVYSFILITFSSCRNHRTVAYDQVYLFSLTDHPTLGLLWDLSRLNFRRLSKFARKIRRLKATLGDLRSKSRPL